MVKRWTVGQSHFPCWAEGPSCETEAFPEGIIKMKKVKKVWNHNTHLCVDLKTQLTSDRVARQGKSYQGVLRRDDLYDDFRYEEHFTFTETVAPTAGQRYPHVFRGKYITVTRKSDGTYRPNFRPMPTGEGFSLERYALGVYNELCMALGGLVEEE